MGSTSFQKNLGYYYLKLFAFQFSWSSRAVVYIVAPWVWCFSVYSCIYNV